MIADAGPVGALVGASFRSKEISKFLKSIVSKKSELTVFLGSIVVKSMGVVSVVYERIVEIVLLGGGNVVNGEGRELITAFW